MMMRRGQSGMRPGNFWVGCLVVLALLLIAAGVGVWFVTQNWRGWVAGPMRDVMQQAMAEVDLPDEERVALEAEINGLIDQFEAGDLSMEQIAAIAQGFAESPLLPATIVMGFDKTYYADNEALTQEQKDAARKQMSRFINGVTSEQIAQTKIDDVVAPISDPNGEIVIDMGQGNPRLTLKKPESTTPEELMQVIANMQAEADAAQIEDKEFKINVADEFTRVVDEALGREPSLPPAPAEPQTPALPEGEG